MSSNMLGQGSQNREAIYSPLAMIVIHITDCYVHTQHKGPRAGGMLTILAKAYPSGSRGGGS